MEVFDKAVCWVLDCIRKKPGEPLSACQQWGVPGHSHVSSGWWWCGYPGNGWVETRSISWWYPWYGSGPVLYSQIQANTAKYRPNHCQTGKTTARPAKPLPDRQNPEKPGKSVKISEFPGFRRLADRTVSGVSKAPSLAHSF